MVLKHVLFAVLLLLPLQAPQPPRNLRLSTSPPPSTVTTYYVKKTGNDANDGLNPITAKLTIAAALAAVGAAGTEDGAGHIVNVLDAGIYEESLINAMPSGSGAGSQFTLTTSAGATIHQPGATYGIGFDTPSHWITINGFKFTGGNAGIYTSGGSVGTHHHISITNNEFTDMPLGGGVVFSGTDYLTFSGNHVHDNGSSPFMFPCTVGGYCHGFYAAERNRFFTIEDNHIHNVSGYGIQIYGEVVLPEGFIVRRNLLHNNGAGNASGMVVYGSEHLIYGNTTYSNVEYGILFRGGNSHIYNNLVYLNGIDGIYLQGGADVYNNSIFDNVGAAVVVDSGPGNIIRNNIFWQNGTDGITNPASTTFTASNNLTTDPSFVDSGTGDFHIQSGSAAIGAALELNSIFTDDFDGVTRGSTWDIGALEFTAEPPPTGGDLDTPAKRKSAIGLALNFLRPGIIPTGSNLDTVGERMHVNMLYAATSAEPGGEMDVTLREIAALSDRVRYSLTDAESRAIRERLGLTDRVTYSLTDTLSVTIRETLGLTDRLSAENIETISTTLRETLGLTDRLTGDQQQPFGPHMVALTHIFLDEGTENYSGHNVIAPAHTHIPKVISFGSIEKEVEVPSGPPRLSDITIRVDDSKDRTTGIQHFRSTFGAKTPRMRKQDILIGPAGGKEHLFYRPAKVSIQRVTFPPLQADIHGSDLRFKWLQKPLPMVINPANFPNLPAGLTEAFFPFVLGIVEAELGALKAIHVDTVLHRYTAAFHPIESVEVFTKTPDEQVFQITPFSYSLVQDALFIEGRENNANYIQFDSALPEGTQVQYNCHGVNFRGDWGTLPSVNEVNRNLVDHTINMLYYIKRLDEPIPDFADYHVASFAEVRDKVAGILSDYAIVEPLTGQEIITQLHAPACVFMIPDNFDRIKLVKITDADFVDAPTIDDRTGTLLRSEVISLAGPTANRYRYRLARNYTDGQWGAEPAPYENTADQDVLGEVEELQVDLHSIRDEDTAASLMAERSLWEDHEAHRIHLKLDAKEKLADIDLLKPFKLDHYGGLAVGGWVQELFIPFRYRLVIDKPLIIELDAIRRPIVHNPEEHVSIIGEWSWNSRVGPEYLTSARRLYLWFVDNRASNKKLVVLGTDSLGVMAPVDDAIYPMLNNEIGSHDGLFVGTMLHLVTQEKVTGRAAYSRFNGANGQYEILNQTILASNSHGDYGITIDVQEPSGKVTVMLQGDREFSSGFVAFPAAGPAGDYQRAYVTVRNTNGTWTTPEMMGNPADAAADLWFPIWGDPNYNGAVHIHTGRAKAGMANRVHFVFSRTEPGDVAVTPDFMIQTLRADGTLSDTYEFEQTGGGGGGANSSPFLGGDPARFEDENGQVWIAFPIGKLAEPKIALFKDIDNPTFPDHLVLLSTAQVQPDTFGARWAPIGVRELNGVLHVIHGTRATSSLEWGAYKTISEPFDSSDAAPSYSGSPRDVVVGAIFGVNDYARSGFDVKTLRDGNTYIFKVTSGNFGISGVNDGKWILEIIDIDDLPTNYTLAEFIAENG